MEANALLEFYLVIHMGLSIYRNETAELQAFWQARRRKVKLPSSSQFLSYIFSRHDLSGSNSAIKSIIAALIDYLSAKNLYTYFKKVTWNTLGLQLALKLKI